MHNRRTLRTDLDIIKFYFERYRYFKENIGRKTKHGVLITHRLVEITLERLLQLMDKEWRGIFEEE
jgi:hypothetical protein